MIFLIKCSKKEAISLFLRRAPGRESCMVDIRFKAPLLTQFLIIKLKSNA